MLSTAIDWLKGLLGSPTATEDSESGGRNDANDGPDLYECEGCGAVFISRPDECSTCEDDDFSVVGKFE